MNWLLLLIAIYFRLSSASFDRVSPAERKALQAGTFPIDVFHVILGFGSFSDLQKFILVSKQMHALTLYIFLHKYGRLAMPHKKVEPHLSKMLVAMKKGDDDPNLKSFIESVDTRLLSPPLKDFGYICLMDPSSIFSNPKAVSALPFIIAHQGNVKKQVLMQLIEAEVYEDIAQEIITLVTEDLCEAEVFHAITCGVSYKTVKALVAQMKPEMASECAVLVHKIFKSTYGPTILESLKELKTIPTALLCFLAENKYAHLLLDLIGSRDDIMVTGHRFWFKIDEMNHGRMIAKLLLKNKENHAGAMMILDPESVHLLLEFEDLTPVNRVAPLVLKTFLSTKKHHGRLLRFLTGKTFTSAEVFEIAVLNGANDTVLHKLFHTTVCSHSQIYHSMLRFVGMPNMTKYITQWIHQLSPQWIFKSLRTVIDSKDQTKIDSLVQHICQISWHLNYAIRALEILHGYPACRAMMLISIQVLMEESKRDISDKSDTASALMSHAQAFLKGKMTLGPLRDLRGLFIKVFGFDSVFEFFTEQHLMSEATIKALKFLPAYLYPFMPTFQFKSMAKKTWKNSPLAGVKFCMDFKVHPGDIQFLIYGLKNKHLLEVVLYAVKTGNSAYIKHFSGFPKMKKKMKILTEYVATTSDFNVQTFLDLEAAFDFFGQQSRGLLHVCLAKSIPEQVIRYIISKYHIPKHLSAQIVYAAALNEQYSDDLIALLMGHCQAEQVVGRLVKKLEEGQIERGEEFVALIRQMASEASVLHTRFKYF